MHRPRMRPQCEVSGKVAIVERRWTYVPKDNELSMLFRKWQMVCIQAKAVTPEEGAKFAKSDGQDFISAGL